MEGIFCNSYMSSNRKWIVDSGANHHMTTNEFKLDNIVDVSKLDHRVYHPQSVIFQNNKIGNMYLSNFVVIFDVLVVHDFNFHMFSVYKLCKDNKFQLMFDKLKCVVQDS